MTERPYLTTADMAEATGKSADFWQRLCRMGALPAVKLGNDWRVERTAFEAFMRGGGQVHVARPGRLSSRSQRRG